MIALRPRLGLGIGRTRLSAVLLDGDTVRWAASRPLAGGEPLANDVRALLASCPRSRLRPPVVVAAIGPAASQLKLVVDLPPLAEPTVIAAIVREQASRFFLKNGVPLVFSGARAASPTSAWAAAFEEPVIRAVIEGCDSVGLTVRLVTPTAIALRFATLASKVVWRDDNVELTVAYEDGAPASVRSSVGSEGERGLPEAVPVFSGIRERFADVMDAAGAARVPYREPIALRGSAIRLTDKPSRRRVAISAAVCVAAIVLALVSPLAASIHVERAARSRDAALHARVRGAERDARDLATATAALGALASFSQSHRSFTLLLAQLTRALPEGSALLALQIDSAGSGSIAAIGPHAAAVVDAVERVPAIASPEIVGPVTRETVAGKQLDRVTVRFRLVLDAAP